MNRTSRLKIAYVAAIVCLGCASAWLIYSMKPPLLVIPLVALALLVPGRIQGFFWREFFRGRRLLADEDPRGAIAHLDRFLTQVRRRPWLKRLIWLSWGTYTRDIEVMTLNNLGAAHLALGDLGTARRALEEGRTLDPRSPLPYYNLALLEQVEGNAGESARLIERARDLGFEGATSDRLFAQAGELLARIEGHGAKRSS
ncbi:MAG: tetratricopeptide repeat protein [Myxococcota bacterium]